MQCQSGNFHEVEESREDHSKYTYFAHIQTLVVNPTTTASKKEHQNFPDHGMGYDEFMQLELRRILYRTSRLKEETLDGLIRTSEQAQRIGLVL